jgi:putative restriction endonuclease
MAVPPGEGHPAAVVEAAHIRPVEDGGPDDLTNGLALCPTHHRLFDKGYLRLQAGPNLLIEVNIRRMVRERVATTDRQ